MVMAAVLRVHSSICVSRSYAGPPTARLAVVTAHRAIHGLAPPATRGRVRQAILDPVMVEAAGLLDLPRATEVVVVGRVAVEEAEVTIAVAVAAVIRAVEVEATPAAAATLDVDRLAVWLM